MKKQPEPVFVTTDDNYISITLPVTTEQAAKCAKACAHIKNWIQPSIDELEDVNEQSLFVTCITWKNKHAARNSIEKFLEELKHTCQNMAYVSDPESTARLTITMLVLKDITAELSLHLNIPNHPYFDIYYNTVENRTQKSKIIRDCIKKARYFARQENCEQATKRLYEKAANTARAIAIQQERLNNLSKITLGKELPRIYCYVPKYTHIGVISDTELYKLYLKNAWSEINTYARIKAVKRSINKYIRKGTL